MLPLQLLPFDVRTRVVVYTDTLARDLVIAREEIPDLPDSVLKWDTYSDPSTLTNDTWGKVFKDRSLRYTINRVKRYAHSEYQAHVSSRQPPYNQFTLTDDGLVEYHAGIGNELILRSFDGIVSALKEWAKGVERRSAITEYYPVVTVKSAPNRLNADIMDLVADYKSKGLTPSTAYGVFVKDRDLRPEVSMKEFAPLFDIVDAHALSGSAQNVLFKPTHYDTLIDQKVQVTPTQYGHSFVWETGNIGGDPGPLSSRYIPLDQYTPQRIADPTATPDVTISWSPAEGLLVYTSTRAYNEILKKYHLKWSRYNEAWYAQGSKGQNRPPPSIGPDRLKYDLERAGAVVALEISEPVSEQELAQIRLEKAQRGADYAGAKVSKATAEAEGHFKRGQAIAARFEFGQPILVGHHSEKKARRDQERIQGASRKAHEAFEKAEHYEAKAASLEGIASVQERIASGQTANDLERVEQIVEAVRALKPKKSLGLDRLGIKAAQTTRGRAKVWADFGKGGENVTANIYASGVNYSGTSLNPMGYEAYPEGSSAQFAAEIVLRGVEERLQQQREATIRRIAEDRRRMIEEAVRKVFETVNYSTYRLEPKKVLSDTERYVKDRAEHFQALLDQRYDAVRRSVGQHTSVVDIEDALHREVYRLAKEEMEQV